jgi:hypothetical protein
MEPSISVFRLLEIFSSKAIVSNACQRIDLEHISYNSDSSSFQYQPCLDAPMSNHPLILQKYSLRY